MVRTDCKTGGFEYRTSYNRNSAVIHLTLNRSYSFPAQSFPASPFPPSPFTAPVTLSHNMLTRISLIPALLRTGNALIGCRAYHGKINLQRPRAVHYEKALFLAVTRPVYPRVTAVDICRKKRQQAQVIKINPQPTHPYKLILKRELFEWFDRSEMILLCHTNSMTQLEYFNFRVECHRKNVATKIYGREIIRLALAGTRFEAMLPVLNATPHNCMLFGNEWNVDDVLKITKRMPKVMVLCGSLGGRFLSRTELEHVAALPDKATVQAQFAATLNSVGSQLVSNLQAHQSNLCQLLDARADALKSPTSPADAEPK